MSRRIWILMVCLVLAASKAFAADAAPPMRWAIVASTEVQASGLADLVTVGLASAKNIELVDHDKIEAAGREFLVDQVFGGGDVPSRVKLGKLLHADRLVLISIQQIHDEKLAAKNESVKAPPSRAVKVVIADTRTGARLYVDYTPSTKGNVEDAATQIIAAVNTTRDRFGGGVKSIIAVPPFLSKNLTHDFDYLQIGLPHVLENALLQGEGIAVVELEEARSIQREIALADIDIASRTVPMILEGEFTARKEHLNGMPSTLLDLTIVARSTGKARDPIVRKDLSREQAAAFLTGEVPAMLADAARGQGMRPEEQFNALVRRADAFALLGFWEQSVALREAAVLLNPKANDQRKAILLHGSNVVWEFRMRASKEMSFNAAKQAEVQARHMARGLQFVAQLRHGFEHIEILIRSGALTQNGALLSSRSMLDDLQTAFFVAAGKNSSPNSSLSAEAIAAEEATRLYGREVFPLIAKLELGEPSPLDKYPSRFDQQMLMLSTASFRKRPMGREQFMALLHCAEHLLPVCPQGPDDPAVGVTMISFVFQHSPGPLDHTFDRKDGGPKPHDEAAYREFLEALQRSNRKALVLCGKFGDLWLKHAATKSPEVRTAIKNLESEWIALYPPKFRSYGAQRLQECNVQLGIVTRDVEHFVAATRPPPGLPPPPGRIGFQPVALSVQRIPHPPDSGKSGFGSLSMGSFVGCGNQFDAVVCSSSILYHRKPGLLEEVLTEPGVEYQDGIWDGEYLWVTTRKNELRVLDAAGRLVCSPNPASGLPPIDAGLKICEFDKGKILATACFGQPMRTWVATIEIQDRRPIVKIFLEAKRNFSPFVDGNAIKPRDDAAAARDMTWSFSADWIVSRPCAADGGPGTSFIIQPHSGGGGVSVGAPTRGAGARKWPLLIDAKTLNVTLMERPFLDRGGSIPPLCLENGETVFADSDSFGSCGIVHFAAPGKTFAGGAPSRVIARTPYCNPWRPAGEEMGSFDWPLTRKLFQVDGLIYAPGGVWFRIDPSNWKVENLGGGTGLGAADRRAGTIGVSAHFGIVYWAKLDVLHRVTIAKESVPDAPPIMASPRPALPWTVTRRPNDVQIEFGNTGINVRGSERTVHLRTRKVEPKSYADARIRFGVYALVRFESPDLLAQFSESQLTQLRCLSAMESRDYMCDPAWQSPVLKAFDGYEAAQPGGDKDSAQAELRAVITRWNETYLQAMNKQIDWMREVMTPEQIRLIDRLGNGIVVEPQSN